MAVRFGTFVPQGWRMDLIEISDPVEKYEAMTNVARTIDALPGYDSAWVFDHFHTVPTPTLETTFESWTITSALARDTKRVKIGQMVTCLGYRNPALLAKMASTVDVLSHGRLYCGIGAGWYEHEWLAYGYGFPDTRDRMRAFREATEILVKMWTEDYPVVKGEYYSIDRPINEPKGVQKPYPSLWIGGSGEQVTLKLVAKYGNACNIGGTPDNIRRKLSVLRDHCETVGRNYDDITRSTNIGIFLIKPGEDPQRVTEKAYQSMGLSYEVFAQNVKIGTPNEIRAHIQDRVDAGINYVITSFPRVAYDHEQLHLFAEEIVPHFQ